MTARHGEAGVILVNVLVALALGSALVMLMLTSQDAAIDRTRRAAAAAQAEALALGAETSVLVALRRDMLEAPEVDHLGEAWALAAQAPVELETGRFAITIEDAQARFDLGALSTGGMVRDGLLERLVAVLELPEDTAGRIAAAMRAEPPPTGLDAIEGLDEQARARLEPYVTILPEPAAVNLNTADALVMGVMLGNLTAARRLERLREGNGVLTGEDLADLGLATAVGVGFRSDVWDVTTLAEVDGVTARLASRLVRRRSTGGMEVIVASRRFGPEAPGAPPALPQP